LVSETFGYGYMGVIIMLIILYSLNFFNVIGCRKIMKANR
jgi:hypothetical protein